VLKSRYFDEARVMASVRARLSSAGLAENQVRLLAPQASVREHLESYAGIDVALDPFPYHGTTTTCEALWMGVPVVTLAGDRHAARVGCSLLQAVGHSEWIATDSDDYVRRAVSLASDAAGRARFRFQLRDEMAASPLLDHAGQAARLGEALRACWRGACAGAASSREPVGASAEQVTCGVA
jgi:predicted O-linked N-acetylglucosamine transferase (SPINDLY family)